MPAATRLCLLVAGCLAGCLAGAGDQCTQESLSRGKLPPELVALVPQIDDARLANDLCKTWASLALGVGVAAVQGGADAVPGAPWTILFKPDVLECASATDCRSLSIGGISVRVVSAERRIHTANVVLSPNRIAPLLADGRVHYIAPNCTAFPLLNAGNAAEPSAAGGPGKPERGCERTDAAQWGMSDACIPAWPANVTSPRTVAVLDSGLDCLHPAIHDRIDGGAKPIKPRRCTTSSGWNYLHPNLPPDHCNENMRVCESHGTGVAGIIASTAREVPGVDPAAELISVRILKANSALDFVEPWTTVATAILDSADRAQIINISANWYTNYPWLAAAIDTVTADDRHLVVSAARENGPMTAYPAAFTQCNDAVIGVSHILRNGDHLPPYYWGGSADKAEAYMVAPGVYVLTSHSDGATGGPVYKLKSGASFAAPHVSGAAALVWGTEEFAECSATGLREILECSGRVTLIDSGWNPRKRLHLGCLFGQRDSPICRGARRCIESAKEQFCR